MRDINFFDKYVEKREFKIDKNLIMFTVATFIVLSFIAFTVYNQLIIKEEGRLVKSLRETAEDTKSLKRITEIKQKQAEVNEFKESVKKIKLLDEIIEKKDIITESLLDTINDNIPNDLFLTSLSIHGSEIQMVGIAMDRWAIAEFQKGLEVLEDYDEIFVSNITKHESYYDFSLNIVLGGTDDNGENEEETQDEGID